MNKLPKDRAPGPDSITNKVIRIVAPLILKELAQAVIKYLATGLPKGLKESFTLILKKKRKKELFTTRRLQAYSPKKHTSKASKEGPYYTHNRESRSEDIITIKLNKRKKRPLYFLSNKPPYINSSDGMKSQARVYSINT